MKGIFDAYILWLFVKKVQNWIVDRSTARDFTVWETIPTNSLKISWTWQLVFWAPNSKFTGMNCQKYNLLLQNWTGKIFTLLKNIYLCRKRRNSLSTERDCHEEMVPTSNNTNGGSQVSTNYKTPESIKYQSFCNSY